MIDQISPGVDAEVLDRCLTRIAQGSTDALAELYEATKTPVYALALSTLKHIPDAEDVLHDSYLQIWSAAPGYVSQGKPLAWILTITKHLSVQRLRERTRSQPLSDEGWACALADCPALSPEDRILLRESMSALSDPEREILLLHAVSGFRHREIAAFLSCPLATVLSRYHRALKKLKRALTKEAESHD